MNALDTDDTLVAVSAARRADHDARPGVPGAPPDAGDPEARRNFRLGVWNGILFQVAEGLIDPGTVIPVLLSTLTRSSALIGFASAMSDMGWFLPQVLVAPAAARRPRQVGIYRRAAFARGVGLFLVAAAAIPLASHPGALLATFFVGYGLYSFAAGAGAVAFMEIVGRTVPMSRLTALWSQRLFWGGLLSAGGALVVRRVLALDALGMKFAILFGLAFVLACTGWALFARVREPAHPPVARPESAAALMRRGFTLLASDTPFRRLLAARTVLNLWLAVFPFLVLFAVRDLGGQARAAGTILIARIAGFVLGNLVWHPLALQRGNRALMIAGTLAASALAMLAALVAIVSPWKLGWISAPAAVLAIEALAFFGGAVHSSLSVGFSSLQIELAPPGERQAFVSLVNTFLGPTLLLPMLGGALLDVTGPPVLFLLCAALSLLGARAASRLPRLATARTRMA